MTPFATEPSLPTSLPTLPDAPYLLSTREAGPLPTAADTAALPGAPRVLMVLEATLGGTMRFMQNLQDALASAPLAIGFAYASERADHQLEPTLRRARELGWKLFPVSMQRQIRPSSDLRALGSLARVIRSFRPHIVHCHSSKAGALGRVAALACRPRPKVFYSPHALAPSRAYVQIERMLAGLTDRFLAVSDTEGAQLAELRVSRPEHTGVVYPVIDGAEYAPRSRGAARAALSLPADRPLLLGLGRMAEQKRPLQFLEVLQAVRRSIPNAQGIWVGAGVLEEAFAERAQELGLAGEVRVTGWVRDVRPWIAAADLVISTSSFESFGYNLAEALAMERPAIGSAVCGTSDVLAGSPGEVLFPSGNTDEAARLATAILRSPELAAQLGAAGRRSVLERFSSEVMRAHLLRGYAEALSPKHAPKHAGKRWRRA